MQKISAGTVSRHNFASCSLHRAFITENAFMLIFLKKMKTPLCFNTGLPFPIMLLRIYQGEEALQFLPFNPIYTAAWQSSMNVRALKSLGKCHVILYFLKI
jgi:hypothetical protein